MHGLRSLSAGDEFNIVAFDHEQAWFSKGMVPCTQDSLASAEVGAATHTMVNHAQPWS